MGKKRKNKDDDDDDDFVPLSDDFPPIPPPAPPGGWIDPQREKILNPHDPPEGGTYAPMPEDPIDIRKFDLRVGRIKFAMNHYLDPESLMLTYIDVGDPFPRPVVSSIGKFYTKESLEERKVVALCNLEPMERKNISNTAMLMCAKRTDSEGLDHYELWDPPPKAKVGDDLRCEDYPMEPHLHIPQLPFMRRSEKVYEEIAAGLKVNDKGEVIYNDTHRLFVRKRPGFVTVPSFTDCLFKEEIV